MQLGLEAGPACFKALPARHHCSAARASLGHEVGADGGAWGLQQQRQEADGTSRWNPSPGPDGGDWQVLQEPRHATEGELGTESETCANLKKAPISLVTLGSM